MNKDGSDFWQAVYSPSGGAPADAAAPNPTPTQDGARAALPDLPAQPYAPPLVNRAPAGFSWVEPVSSPKSPAVQGSLEMALDGEEPRPELPVPTLQLDRFKFAPGMDKSDASHHDGEGFAYYKIPLDQEESMQKLITIAYLRCKPRGMSEHPVSGKRCRFYLDVDTPVRSASDLQALVSITDSVLHAHFRNLDHVIKIPAEALRNWNVKIDRLADKYVCVCLASPVGDSTFKSHLIWPFIRVTQQDADALLAKIRQLVDKTQFPDSGKIEHPRTLRAYLCDRFERNTDGVLQPCNRPYVFRAVFRDDGKIMRGDADPDPDYPFFDTWTMMDQHVDPLVHHRQVWAMVSLRWDTAYGVTHDEDSVISDIVRENEALEFGSNTWSKSNCWYDARKMQQLLDALGEEPTFEMVEECVVDYINRSCAEVVNMHGYVMRSVTDEDRPQLLFVSPNAMLSHLMAPLVSWVGISIDENTGKTRKTRKNKHAGKVWVESAKHLVFQGIVFDPAGRANKRFLNTWTGFRYEPDDYDMHFELYFSIYHYFDHIYNVWCNKDFESFYYVLRWFAYLIQYPGKATNTLIIIGGPEGCGKSAPASVIGHIMGDAYLRTNNINDLLGRFNGHTMGKIFMQIDEVDTLSQEQNQTLKAIVTDDVKRFENKYCNTVSIKQCVNLIMTTNRPQDRLMQVNPNSRRWVMLEAQPNDHSKKDWYDNMFRWLEEDRDAGYKAIFSFLRHVSLQGFDPKKLPVTHMLVTHMLSDMPSELQFLWEQLRRGYFIITSLSQTDTGFKRSEEHQVWDQLLPLIMEEFTFYHCYQDWCALSKRKPKSKNAFELAIQQVVLLLPVNHARWCAENGQNEFGVPPNENVFILPSAMECFQLFYSKYNHLGELESLSAKKRSTTTEWEHVDWNKVPLFVEGGVRFFKTFEEVYPDGDGEDVVMHPQSQSI